MGKFKFEGEYEINASNKMIYSYLSTASGLAQWYADDVNVDSNKNFVIVWNGEEYKAKISSHRLNQEVTLEFISDDPDPNYVKFEILLNELTQEHYIKVTDYSEIDDREELQDLWRNLTHELKEIVGG